MAKTIQGGLLIAFEGIDGAGKTTQLKRAEEELSRAGWDVTVRRNLGGTPIGEDLREVIKSPIARPPETNLYISAAIQEALIEAIIEDRHAGKVILMDRSPLSLAAYEIYGSKLNGDLTWPHVDRGMQALQPDLLIIYMLDAQTALKRLNSSGESDYFESKPLDYFERVAQGYQELAQRYKALVIDGSPNPDDVYIATMQALQEALAARAED